jgi:hypothetical protein
VLPSGHFALGYNKTTNQKNKKAQETGKIT